MQTLYTDSAKTDEENAQEAMKVFSFLSMDSAMNLILWLQERPMMSGIIDLPELETLKTIVW